MRRRKSVLREMAVPGLLMLGAGVLIASCRNVRPVGNAAVPEPAGPVDLNRYLGRWNEVGRYDSHFERDCEGVTAEYSLRPDGLIRVVNSCRRGAPDGPLHWIEGKAKVVEGSDGAKLSVSFFGPFFLGDYWVLDHAEDYSWSIVGEPSGKYLWILSRDATPEPDRITFLYDKARHLGYDTSLLRLTSQPPGPLPGKSGWYSKRH